MAVPKSHFHATTRAENPREIAMGTRKSRGIRKSAKSQKAGSCMSVMA